MKDDSEVNHNRSAKEESDDVKLIKTNAGENVGEKRKLDFTTGGVEM